MSTPNTPLAQPPERVLQWRDLANQYANVHPILKPEEILAIIWTESWGNPKAVNLSDPSWGLMQVTLPVGRMFAGVTTSDELFVPENNIKAGSGFMAHLKIAYAHAWPITDLNSPWICGYNEGEPNLVRHRPDPAYAKAYLKHLAVLGGKPE